jgi:predicted dehydrogenase
MKNNKNIYRYKAVIIGAGKIGSGYDTPKSKAVLTHAHALSNNPRIELVGITDTDSVRGKAEARKWKTVYWADMRTMLIEVNPDIIVIATPSETHKDLLREAFKVKPKVIIVEKPVVNKKSEMNSIRRAGSKAGVPVVVNFRRRFDGTVSEVRDGLIKGTYGRVLSASALYSKGILHNGSHLIDLARYFFGEMTSSKMSFAVEDFPSGEPSLGGVATFEHCPQFYFMAGDERSFYVFEMTILTEKYRIRFIHEGRTVTFEEVVRDRVYPEDFVLGPIKVRKTALANAMVRMVEHVVQVADGTESSRVSLEDALKTQESCYKLLASFKK